MLATLATASLRSASTLWSRSWMLPWRCTSSLSAIPRFTILPRSSACWLTTSFRWSWAVSCSLRMSFLCAASFLSTSLTCSACFWLCLSWFSASSSTRRSRRPLAVETSSPCRSTCDRRSFRCGPRLDSKPRTCERRLLSSSLWSGSSRSRPDIFAWSDLWATSKSLLCRSKASLRSLCAAATCTVPPWACWARSEPTSSRSVFTSRMKVAVCSRMSLNCV
mmetsp:Transcript_30058/g.89303  ORF Transcript_30058/g.89303 Transcript_30058/m.89303 type:complete len:221 (-) Transcript_30058:183-845(-)